MEDAKAIVIESSKLAKIGEAKLKEILSEHSQIALAGYPLTLNTSTPCLHAYVNSSDAGQKLKIVRGLQKAEGESGVIAVTGSAVGDCQSLSTADVGIALGGSSEAVLHAADVTMAAGTSFDLILEAVEFGTCALLFVSHSVLLTLPFFI